MSAVILTFAIHIGLVLLGYWLGLLKGKKDLEAFIKSYPEVEEAYIFAVSKETEKVTDSKEKEIKEAIEKLEKELSDIQTEKEADPEEDPEKEAIKKQFTEKEFTKFI